MNKTTVVNIKTTPDFNPTKNPDDVYIGRFYQSSTYGNFPSSRWHNPYRIGTYFNKITGITEEITREDSIRMYRDYITSNSKMMTFLPELKGKRLGCWCSPLACYGDILVELIESTLIAYLVSPLAQDKEVKDLCFKKCGQIRN